MTSQLHRPQKQKSTAQDVLMTEQTSVQEVKTLMDAAIGCICFLRGVFADDCFYNEAIGHSAESTTKGSGVNIRKLRRGGGRESDALLNYMEGVKDALDRKYLKTMMLAIYVDPDHPADLIECYTLNFSYYEQTVTAADGSISTTKVPVMDVRNDMDSLSLKDPVGGSSSYKVTRKQRPERSQVKKAIATLIRRLISMTQSLEELPRVRFLSMKLYYVDGTPDDYQPPHFNEIDYQANKYKFGTHDVDEVPERTAIGRINTGYHSVSLNLASIVSCLPPTPEEAIKLDAAVYESEVLYNKAEASERPVVWDAEDLGEQDSEAEMEEASLARNGPASMRKPKPLIVPLELPEVEPKSPTRASGSNELLMTASNLAAKPPARAVERDVDQPTIPVSAKSNVTESTIGVLSDDPIGPPGASVLPPPQPMQIDHVHRPPPFDELTALMNRAASTQSFMPTQSAPPHSPPHERIADLRLDEPDVFMESQFTETSASTIATNVLKGQMQAFAHHAGEDIGSPELIEQDSPETPFAPSQAIPRSQKISMDLDLPDDPIEESSAAPAFPLVDPMPVDREVGNDSGIVNFISPKRNLVSAARDRAANAHLLESQIPAEMPERQDEPALVSGNKKETESETQGDDVVDNTDPCDCGSSTFEGEMVACDKCGLWVHQCCYGYEENAFEERDFSCYKCRSWSQEANYDAQYEGHVQTALEAFRTLALFRHVLTLCAAAPEMPTAARLKEMLSCDLQVATQLYKRLVDEGFVYREDNNESQRSGRGKGKSVKKQRAVFNRKYEQSKWSRAQYFTPGQGLEKDTAERLAQSLTSLRAKKQARTTTQLTNSDAMCEPEAEAESAHFVSPEQLKAAQRQDASRDRRVAREKAASDQLDQAMGQIQSPALQPVGLNSPQSSPRPGRVSSAGPIASSTGTPKRSKISLGKRRSNEDADGPINITKRHKASGVTGIMTVQPFDDGEDA